VGHPPGGAVRPHPDLKAGVLVLLVVLVGIPFLTQRSLPWVASTLLGGIPLVLAVLAFALANDVDASIGIGLIASAIAGLVIAADPLLSGRP
jgi:hypothetical protein